MISAKAFAAYTKATNKLAQTASKTVEAQTLELIEKVGINNVAAIREGSKSIMSSVMESCDNSAASLAAQFYDTQAFRTHPKLPAAITESTYSEELVSKVAHYQAKKLVSGDAEGFAKACGELVLNSAKQSLNATILANCKRDEGEGVMFARVLVGYENCKFCIMLAGRGAVYHSRKTAGELNHYHRRCDCKIVPDFEGGDPMRTLVEGHDPWGERRTWQRLENAEVITANLYQPIPAELNKTEEDLDKELKKKWEEQKAKDDYQGIYGEYLAKYGVSAEDYTHIEGKELQAGQWLAAQGFEVQFLHTKGNLHTPDILMNGEQWEIKRITADKAKTMRERIGQGLRQSSNIIVDLSANRKAEEFIIPAVKMLEDKRASRIMIICEGKVIVYKK